jgi:AcrR family transcriptional regulator
MVPTRQERKEETVRRRREQILDAAMEVFSRKGFAMATTAEIAREAGVAEGTIYNYFPSKRELFIAVIKNFVITGPLLELIDKLPQGDIAVTFGHILQNRFRLIESENVSRMPSLMAEIIHDPELKELWTTQFLQPFLSKMEGIYESLMTTGKFRRIEPPILVRSIGGMFLGFLILKMMEGEASPLNRLPQEKVISSMSELILHGLVSDITDKKD